MKNIKLTILLSTVLLFVAGCDNDFEEVNTNPFAVLTGKPDLMLAGSQRVHTGEWQTENTIVQHFVNPFNTGATLGPNFNADIDGYNNGNWNSAYPGTIKNLVEALYILGENTDQVNLKSMIRIWKANVFMGLVDAYGDVPYFQAGLGYREKIYYPVYDDDAVIYGEIERELRESIAALDPTKDFVAADLFYGSKAHTSVRTTTAANQVAKWKKLGNSILLRLGMRYSEINPTKAAALVTEAFNGGVMTSNADMAFIIYPDGNFNNGVNTNLLNNNPRFYYVAKPFVDQLVTTLDPRAKFMVASFANPGNPTVDTAPKTGFADLIGVPVGKLDTQLPAVPAPRGQGLGYSQVHFQSAAAGNAPTFYHTYAQVSLLLAEAKLNNYITGGLTVKEYYENGVKAHMDMFTLVPKGDVISTTDKNTYLADANVSYDVADVEPDPVIREDKILTLIGTQYWIANFTNGLEAWSNFRRTGKPALIPNNSNTNLAPAGGFVNRLSYPDEELTRNGTNYRTAAAAIGGDNLLSRVFWDLP
jgi:hypothetical protein